jgi:O-6-methylguanine DNA methyltransferase
VSAEGPVGRLFAAYNPRGVSFVSLADDPGEFASRFTVRFDRPLRPADRPPRGLVRSLETVQAAKGLHFDLRGLSPFSRAVLSVTRTIPRGEVRSYSWVARQAGRPAAVRAAGTVLARNPVPFLVPCHRVVRHDGSIGNYGGGSEMKQTLLEGEGVDLGELGWLIHPSG